jgi:hypothetical protein
VGEEVRDTLYASILVQMKICVLAYLERIQIRSGTDGIICQVAGLVEVLLRDLPDLVLDLCRC